MERRYSYDESMVLRTVYLPRKLDEKLRAMAYEQRKSKNELIRTFLVNALASVPETYVAEDAALTETSAQASASLDTAG
jgi:hypothetical protein